jgi:hypothetical protein
MTIVRKRAPARNSHRISQPDLFSWCPFPVLTVAPVAVRKLAERYGISIAHATIVARLAGLGGSEVRQ